MITRNKIKKIDMKDVQTEKQEGGKTERQREVCQNDRKSAGIKRVTESEREKDRKYEFRLFSVLILSSF